MYPRKNDKEIIQTQCMFKIICHKLNNKSRGGGGTGEHSNYKKMRENYFLPMRMFTLAIPLASYFAFVRILKGFLSLHMNIITEWLQISNLFHLSEIGNKLISHQ